MTNESDKDSNLFNLIVLLHTCHRMGIKMCVKNKNKRDFFLLNFFFYKFFNCIILYEHRFFK